MATRLASTVRGCKNKNEKSAELCTEKTTLEGHDANDRGVKQRTDAWSSVGNPKKTERLDSNPVDAKDVSESLLYGSRHYTPNLSTKIFFRNGEK